MPRFVIVCDVSPFCGVNYYVIDTKKEKGKCLPKTIGKLLYAISKKMGYMFY